MTTDVEYLRSFEHRDELGAHGVVVLRQVLERYEDAIRALKAWVDEVDGTYPFESLPATKAAISKAEAA